MLSVNPSAGEGLCPIKVGGGDVRLISNFPAEEILRSVQGGGETMLSLIRLDLVSRQLSTSLIDGISFGNSRLLVSAEESWLGRRMRSLSESSAKRLGGGRVLLWWWLQRASDERWGYDRLRLVKSWRRAGMEATAIPMFCSRLQGCISGVGRKEGMSIRCRW